MTNSFLYRPISSRIIIQYHIHKGHRTLKFRQTSKKKKTISIILFVFALVVLGVGIYAYVIYHSFDQAIDTMHEPVQRESEHRPEPVVVEEQEPFSVLLLGVDERDYDSGRSDTIIVLTVNPNKETIKMLSIPRDTRTEIIGKGSTEKINHAYAHGGVEMAMDTVESFLKIPIDYFVQINMDGFKDIVDAVDGVTVNNDMDLTYGNHHFPEGEVTLTGEEALVFSRIRKEDPRGDFGRQLRQKQVIQAVINEGVSVSSLWNFQDIFEAIGGNIKTNMAFKEMVTMQQQYSGISTQIEQLQFENGSGGYVGNLI